MKLLKRSHLDSVDISVPEHSHLYYGIIPHHEAKGLVKGALPDDLCVLTHKAVLEPLDADKRALFSMTECSITESVIITPVTDARERADKGTVTLRSPFR